MLRMEYPDLEKAFLQITGRTRVIRPKRNKAKKAAPKIKPKKITPTAKTKKPRPLSTACRICAICKTTKSTGWCRKDGNSWRCKSCTTYFWASQKKRYMMLAPWDIAIRCINCKTCISAVFIRVARTEEPPNSKLYRCRKCQSFLKRNGEERKITEERRTAIEQEIPRQCAFCGTQRSRAWHQVSGPQEAYQCNSCLQFCARTKKTSTPSIQEVEVLLEEECINCGSTYTCCGRWYPASFPGEYRCQACHRYYVINLVERPRNLFKYEKSDEQHENAECIERDKQSGVEKRNIRTKSSEQRTCSNCGISEKTRWYHAPQPHEWECRNCHIYRLKHGKPRPKEFQKRFNGQQQRIVRCNNCKTCIAALYRKVYQPPDPDGFFAYRCNSCHNHFQMYNTERLISDKMREKIQAEVPRHCIHCNSQYSTQWHRITKGEDSFECLHCYGWSKDNRNNAVSKAGSVAIDFECLNCHISQSRYGYSGGWYRIEGSSNVRCKLCHLYKERYQKDRPERLFHHIKSAEENKCSSTDKDTKSEDADSDHGSANHLPLDEEQCKSSMI